MGFKEAVRTCLTEKYVTFSGRASRSEYWYYMLFVFLVMIALIIGFLIFGGVSDLENGGGGAAMMIFGGLYVLFALATFLPGISVYVRRFHDRDLSGWWILAVIVGGMIPFVGILASIAGFVITVLKGTDGPNRFGDDPLNPSNSADVFS